MTLGITPIDVENETSYAEQHDSHVGDAPNLQDRPCTRRSEKRGTDPCTDHGDRNQ